MISAPYSGSDGALCATIQRVLLFEVLSFSIDVIRVSQLRQVEVEAYCESLHPLSCPDLAAD